MVGLTVDGREKLFLNQVKKDVKYSAEIFGDRNGWLSTEENQGWMMEMEILKQTLEREREKERKKEAEEQSERTTFLKQLYMELLAPCH